MVHLKKRITFHFTILRLVPIVPIEYCSGLNLVTNHHIPILAR